VIYRAFWEKLICVQETGTRPTRTDSMIPGKWKDVIAEDNKPSWPKGHDVATVLALG